MGYEARTSFQIRKYGVRHAISVYPIAIAIATADYEHPTAGEGMHLAFSRNAGTLPTPTDTTDTTETLCSLGRGNRAARHARGWPVCPLPLGALPCSVLR